MSCKICCVCKSENGKYKCPKCKENYCSVTCCNTHKKNCFSKVEPKDPTPNSTDSLESYKVEYDFPTEDTVPIEKLGQLQDSEEVKNCLKNPQIRDIITSVLKSKDLTKAIAEAMTEPLFVELADACLKIVESPDDEKPC